MKAPSPQVDKILVLAVERPQQTLYDIE